MKDCVTPAPPPPQYPYYSPTYTHHQYRSPAWHHALSSPSHHYDLSALSRSPYRYTPTAHYYPSHINGRSPQYQSNSTLTLCQSIHHLRLTCQQLLCID
ncbi:unnamed protein product [Rotaria magnacalcarata]|uniref:Uncharacterized protein n=1 Tax=Rotaria magnacalcarata TaxID=392030 RepID=A0A8S2TZD9_9BILA|nr:unnamed protein product [Rotaria magnacalcarata]CAF4316972.1 unnamed protein product [Rotaria magnacalcarata]